MSLLVVGSVAYDSIETPFGKVEDELGGSAVYFSMAASHFADVKLVAVVGEDFRDDSRDQLKEHDIDLSGLMTEEGETFRWSGRYHYDLNQRDTLSTDLNVLESFNPQLPEGYRDTPIVFLANIAPQLQLSVLDQIESPKFVALDTMNFWIEGEMDALTEVLKRIDMLVINDGEARQLADEPNLVKAAAAIRKMGPKELIIKQGEHGALYFSDHGIFSAPALPLEFVQDPTGAGDTFAGGFMGYLASAKDMSDATMRAAIIYGSACASFAVEDFGVRKLATVSRDDIDDRYRAFVELTSFAHI